MLVARAVGITLQIVATDPIRIMLRSIVTGIILTLNSIYVLLSKCVDNLPILSDF